MNVPNTEAQRGILIGVSLGGIAIHQDHLRHRTGASGREKDHEVERQEQATG